MRWCAGIAWSAGARPDRSARAFGLVAYGAGMDAQPTFGMQPSAPPGPAVPPGPPGIEPVAPPGPAVPPGPPGITPVAPSGPAAPPGPYGIEPLAPPEPAVPPGPPGIWPVAPPGPAVPRSEHAVPSALTQGGGAGSAMATGPKATAPAAAPAKSIEAINFVVMLVGYPSSPGAETRCRKQPHGQHCPLRYQGRLTHAAVWPAYDTETVVRDKIGAILVPDYSLGDRPT